MTPARANDDAINRLGRLHGEVERLLARLSEAESSWSQWIDQVVPEYRCSARNLVHYWAIRQVDLRGLQAQLAAFGLSSLGRSEPHVQATLRLVAAAIAAMRGGGWRPPDDVAVSVDAGATLSRRNAVDLLGPVPARRAARIMVTLPSEAATDPELVVELVERGMNIARINCAHDDAEAWRMMADHVHEAAEATNRTCLIAMDLAGPKLRTGPLEPGPRVVRLRPSRNKLGQVVAPARAWVTSAQNPAAPPEPGMVSLPVPGDWLGRRRGGGVLVLHDTRGSKRHLVLTRGEDAAGAGGLVATTEKTTYLATGTVLGVKGADDPTALGELAPTEQSLRLRAGDILTVTRDCTPAPVGADDAPRIGCTLPEVFDHVRVGEKIYFDDGKLSGEIVSVEPDELKARIDHPAHGEAKLRAGKGINVPDTDLLISAITDKDLADLSTVVELADLVELSFVRDPSDVRQLLDELRRHGDGDTGVVLKIETRQAFEQLPQLVLTAMRRRRVGVMIARGDRAVESGYERMAELQEEMLWLCEAAHLPVIWATQVLEQLATTGLPSRAEISDAAMSERAECVMLNKGPYVNEAVVALDSILRRMAGHHYKKNALLRTLHSWRAAS